ncbi:hypothetical protein DEA8626_03174 [Defluviimonas aquaemixtae]|uniref:Uncharacterized protein n=1 Tax=Albidovulum aquaemixtae TaxID=1542388 RepID=A0A2R8BL44_9RHOB|nr:hypothetical protein [Defluviimonas aquaemixtae]SPH24125.1 hypothetical protein DEA8626_03174 [Defluviimonas aquaemixtae]
MAEQAAAAPDPAPEAEPEELAALEPPPAEPQAEPTSARPTDPDAPIGFTTPLAIGGPEVEGRSIAQLIDGSPLFPPIEGLPEELWKEQKCSACHNWTQEALCEQGKTYQSNEEALSKQHPLGGGLKRALKAWAAAGCN